MKLNRKEQEKPRIIVDVKSKLYSEFEETPPSPPSSLPKAPEPSEKKPSVLSAMPYVTAPSPQVKEKDSLEKKALAKLEKQNKEIEKELLKWKGLADKYYEEKEFIKKKLKRYDQVLSGAESFYQYLRKILAILRMPSLIGLMLILNAILLLSVVVTLFTHSKKDVVVMSEDALKTNIASFSIHIGQYDSFDEAKKDLLSLKSKGFEPFISKSFDNDKEIYRVYVGHYQQPDQAEEDLKDIHMISEFKNSYVRKRF